MASESNYTVALDTEGTAQHAQQGLGWASDQLAQRSAFLDQMYQAKESLGHWAQEFKDQMGHPDQPGTTLHSANNAGSRVYGSGHGGYTDHYNTMMKTTQVMPQTDADHAAKFQALETDT